MIVGVIPDLHGKDVWKKIVEDKSVRYWIFMGDYLDDSDVSDEAALDNFKEIVEFAKSREFCKLLYGNHELPYLYPKKTEARCSGTRHAIVPQVHEILHNPVNSNYFKNSMLFDNFLLTHAGVSKSWFDHEFEGNRNVDISYQLDNPKDKAQFNAMFTVSYYRGGGDLYPGPFWQDKSEFVRPLPGYTQIVGHSRVSAIHKENIAGCDIYFTDCLDRKLEYLTFDTKSQEVFINIIN